ncbi:hypothetical protein Zmor_008339 [Zophobas morio]|uniref:Uncharacterized protein n=1 Tax=Zophobas morio TaxID=2755281 RepID=A0AA38MQM9_9CUCU|nr:hypothetical protein Zmor_008339 [Zophobas morio]
MDKLYISILCLCNLMLIFETVSEKYSNTKIEYSREDYYDLLTYIKRHHLLDLDQCPQTFCFRNVFCIDLCQEASWP